MFIASRTSVMPLLENRLRAPAAIATAALFSISVPRRTISAMRSVSSIFTRWRSTTPAADAIRSRLECPPVPLRVVVADAEVVREG
ncbi:MAG: hypothetical protein U5O16_00250 [Rhodococcus sp. (in: high G+C Gram-positive bacteria)]|uniref:hypothetical protein n=1 Tax=Rhodococcus sp. TaxID=1831 RepID=UPI002AD84D89|nr:hypothetical protein [Rhodococcus sp. (in: high G+C Gram-positive bacteria)]